MQAQRQARVLVIGGGVAALELVLALRRFAGDLPDIVVLAPDSRFVYRPWAVAEPFGLTTARRFELAPLLARAGAEQFVGMATRVDTERRTVATAGGTELGYDLLAVATGARPFAAIPGALTVAVGDGFQRLGLALDELRDGDRAVVAAPAGTSWTLPAYELALLSSVAYPDLVVAIATPEERPLEVFGRPASDAVAELLRERGVEFHPRSHAAVVEADQLQRRGAEPLEAALVVAMPGLRGPAIDGLPHDSEGFIPIDASCRVDGTPRVYAAGDCANFQVKQGGLAAQQAVVVAAGMASELGVEAPAPEFKPVLRGLLLTGGFPQYLHADIAGDAESRADVEPMWWPPSKIAAEHLSQVLAFAAAGQPLPAEDPFTRFETDDIGHLLRR